MELRQLKYFVTVATQLHFGKAAKLLDITQPALSKQIRVLETDLQVQLFFRSKRQVELTSAGKVFYQDARQLLKQAEEAVETARRTARGEAGKLIIGFTPTAMYSLLPKSIRRFKSLYPEVKIEMLQLSTEAQVTALALQKIDLGFLHPPIDSRGLELHPIFAEEFVVVLPQEHHLNDKSILSLEDLAEESFILHSREEGKFLYDEFIQLCQKQGFQPRITQETDSHQTRMCFVEAGIGITFMPVGLKMLVSKNLICKAITNFPLQLEFAAVWRSITMLQTLKNFLTILKTI